ncbi:MAG: hypothetical protein ACRC76_02605, partial [Proteocatella sp.]
MPLLCLQLHLFTPHNSIPKSTNSIFSTLVLFISKYILLAQWAHDDKHSPKYQKFKTNKLPLIQPFFKQDWKFLLAYYEHKYQKKIKAVQRRNGSDITEDIF